MALQQILQSNERMDETQDVSSVGSVTSSRSILGCEEDNLSIDEDDINRPNAIDNKTVMEQESSDYDHETDIRESNTNKISIPSIKSSQNNTNERLNDDIRIIDLESRGEESVSSYGRSTSDSPNPNFSPLITNGIPSNSASFTDQERETASPLSDNSSTNSPTESPPRRAISNDEVVVIGAGSTVVTPDDASSPNGTSNSYSNTAPNSRSSPQRTMPPVSPDMSHVSVIVVGGVGDNDSIHVIDSSLATASQNKPDTPTFDKVIERSYSSASHSSNTSSIGTGLSISSGSNSAAVNSKHKYSDSRDVNESTGEKFLLSEKDENNENRGPS